jgi:hyperosmotically inducible periplasmic protein
MHADLRKGTWMQFKDKLKLQWGKFVKHDLQENERSYAKIIGMIQERYGRNCANLVRERYGENQDELMKWADQWQRRAQPEATMDMTRRGEIIKMIWMTEYGHITRKEKMMKTHYLRTLSFALVVGAVLTAVPATAVDISKEKALINDSWLTAKTKIALAADSRVKGRQIEVETTQGQVMLRGKVDSDVAKRAAEGITAGLDGVKTVKNDLEVVPPSAREAEEEKDEAITARVKEHIAKDSTQMKDSRLKDADINVHTNAGVVSLTGEVSDMTTSAQASWTTRQVPGVKSVKNDLTVKEKT